MFDKKQVIRLHYPESTLVESNSEFKSRTLRVEAVRDLVQWPLTPREFLRRPLTNRGRWLILARDVERHCYRQFYLASSAEFHAKPDLKVGLFLDGKLVEVLDCFKPTRRERILASRYIKVAATLDFDECQVGIFSDELRLVG